MLTCPVVFLILELNSHDSKAIEREIKKLLYPVADSVQILMYQPKGNGSYKKYVKGYIKVNKNYFSNDSIFENTCGQPLIKGIMLTIKSGKFVVDVRFNYKNGDTEINHDEYYDLSYPSKN